jgi:pimeloyl-ACP methyl ester carboxylesterase
MTQGRARPRARAASGAARGDGPAAFGSWLGALDWMRADAAGESFGAMIAMELAIRHPDRVACMAPVAGAHGRAGCVSGRSRQCGGPSAAAGRAGHDAWDRLARIAAPCLVIATRGALALGADHVRLARPARLSDGGVRRTDAGARE